MQSDFRSLWSHYILLRYLVVIDLKLGELTHADAGQMHLYLNYAREHWTRADENPPVGLILCAKKDAVAKYASRGTPQQGARKQASIEKPTMVLTPTSVESKIASSNLLDDN